MYIRRRAQLGPDYMGICKEPDLTGEVSSHREYAIIFPWYVNFIDWIIVKSKIVWRKICRYL